MTLIKLRHNMLLLLTGIRDYCADLNKHLPSAHVPETQAFVDDLARIQAVTLEIQAWIQQQLSGIQRVLKNEEAQVLKNALRKRLEGLIQHCKSAKDTAPLFNAEREIIEITRAARYLIHLTQQLTQPSSGLAHPIHAAANTAPAINRLLTQTGTLLLVATEALWQQLDQPLSHAGHTLSHANSIPAGLQLLANHTYELILIDTQLGDKDSLAFLQRIRQTYTLAELPIMMLREHAQCEQTIQDIQFGANDSVSQPSHIPLLSALIRKQLIAKHVSEQSGVSNMFIRSTLASYLTSAVADQLFDTPQGLSMQGEKLKVTILFSDLRGFTSMSEKLDANTVVQLLNTYLSHMIDLVSEFDGIINEVMGDGLLVVFGVPHPRPNDAERAVACAIAMQTAMSSVNTLNQQKNLPTLEMGIGINTGEVAAGNIGSVLRTKYSVVGQHVNLAARVESQTMGGQILITDNTLQDITPRCHINSSSKIKAKGIDQPITLYDIGGIEGDFQALLPEQDGKMFHRAHPLPISFKIIQGKKINHQVISGKITAVSSSGTKAQISTHSVPSLMSDIIFHLGTSTIQMHAKVTKVNPHTCEITLAEISDRTTLCQLLEADQC